MTVQRGSALRVNLLGSGARALVLSDESDEDLCAWLPFAKRAAAAGFLVALYDYARAPVDDVIAVSGYLRAHGARTISLVGASQGAKASLCASATVRPDALVTLSAELVLTGRGDVTPCARKLRGPTLFVTAARDPYGSTSATRIFEHVDPARTKPLLIVPGSAHGTALLAATTVRAAVLAFLQQHSQLPLPRAEPCDKGFAAVRLRGPDGISLEANTVGDGPVAVVFMHEIGTTGMCGFSDYARWLTDHYRVRAVLVNRCDYGTTVCPPSRPAGDALITAETAPAIAWARAHEAARVVLVGASGGGGDALQAAGVLGVDAVIDVSGDVTDTGIDVTAAARRVHVPALVAVAADDASCPLPQIRAQYRLLPARTKRFYLNPVTGVHGWSMLTDVDGRPLPLAPVVARWIQGRYR